MASETVRSFCRACMNSCPTLVDVEDGRLVRVRGDNSNDIWRGYSCIKGQSQPALHHHERRLLGPMKRGPDGTHVRVRSELAISEIALSLRSILERHGPRSVAYYGATGISQSCLAEPFFGGLLRAIGSPMRFSPNTIDKPGKQLALALHGAWHAPLQGYHDPEVALLIGTNPYKSYYGAAAGNPGAWLRARMAGGMDLLVIDPRTSDVAKRAGLHLQPRPGFDVEILACLVNVTLRESLYDRAFVEENTRGVAELARAVSAFTPERVGSRADVPAQQLIECARRFAGPRRGYAVCGVGPGFSSSSTLVEYLVLVLETLCGHWMREGEVVSRVPTLLPAGPYYAQAGDPKPAWDLGVYMGYAGLTQTAAGLPTGVLAEEILQDGKNKVRALICAGGNPVLSWPDQLRAVKAMRSLELLVVVDPFMTATAQEADYVIAPTLPYEMPGTSVLIDNVIALPTYYGPAEAWGQYTPPCVLPPEGSDVMPEWEFVYGLAQAMNLELELQGMSLTPTGTGGSAGTNQTSAWGIPVDMENKPTADDLMEALFAGGRVSLAEVKKYPSGHAFADPAVTVRPKQAGWPGRFELADPAMIQDLLEVLDPGQVALAAAFPYRLIMIRVQNQFNSTLNDEVMNKGRSYNPAFMHPEDLSALELEPGTSVIVSSSRGSIPAVVEPEADLRRGLVAMSFAYGGPPESDSRYLEIGSSPSRLLTLSDFTDSHVGMPRIGNVPVSVRRKPTD